MSPPFAFAAALPEIVLGGAACLILIVDLFVAESRRQISYWLTRRRCARSVACSSPTSSATC
jgi:hypothetical protein